MSNILIESQSKYLESFKREQNELITQMENFAAEHKVPILNWHAAEFLEQLIRIKKPVRVLEIGTAIAYSTIKIARNFDDNQFIDTIEKSTDNIPIAEKNIAQSGLQSRVNILKGDALDIMPRLEYKYDFIFLDADKEDYKKLFELSLPLLDEDGVIFVDNLLWQGYTASENVPDKYMNSTRHIREFNKFFMNESSLNSTILPIGDGVGLGIKKGSNE